MFIYHCGIYVFSLLLAIVVGAESGCCLPALRSIVPAGHRRLDCRGYLIP